MGWLTLRGAAGDCGAAAAQSPEDEVAQVNARPHGQLRDRGVLGGAWPGEGTPAAATLGLGRGGERCR